MKRNINEKHIALDDPTREFLCSLRSLRERTGHTLRYTAKCLGIYETTLYDYEKGRHKPSLRMLMKLSEFFEHDLSSSINYKFYHGKICAAGIKRSLNRYGLTYPELSKLTGYDTAKITEAVNLRPNGSILCLSAVIEVIKLETHMQKVRRELLRKGPYRKVALR